VTDWEGGGGRWGCDGSSDVLEKRRARISFQIDQNAMWGPPSFFSQQKKVSQNLGMFWGTVGRKDNARTLACEYYASISCRSDMLE
jgi:hypothetical protein